MPKVAIKLKNNRPIGIKAKPDGAIPEPVVDERYFAVGMLTSVVQKVSELSDGWLITTNNSTYAFRSMSEDDLQAYIKESGLEVSGFHEHGHDGLPSRFWGNIAGAQQLNSPFIMAVVKESS